MKGHAGEAGGARARRAWRGLAGLTVAALLLAGAPMVGLDVAPAAEAGHSVATMGAKLPTPNRSHAAVWAGDVAYLFGGSNDNGALDTIVRFDPKKDETRLMGARLPAARDSSPSAVWNGTHAFVFGGWGCGFVCNDIVRYDPASDTAVRMAAKLPAPRYATSAVWAGGVAYIFGGYTGQAWTEDILRYDPSTDTVAATGALYQGAYSSAVWTGSKAYILPGAGQDQIRSYEPGGGVSVVAKLPRRSGHTAAFWDGTNVVVAGGGGCSFYCDDIFRFEPESGKVVTHCAKLPAPRTWGPGVFDGRYGYIFGGENYVRPTLTIYDDIVRVPVAPNCKPVAVILRGVDAAAGEAGPLGPVFTAECVNGRADVTLSAAGSSDPDGDPLTYAWTAPGIGFQPDARSMIVRGSFPLGSTTVTLAVSDGELGDTTTATVQVVDTLNPTVAITRPTRGHVYLAEQAEVPLPTSNIVVVGPVTVLADARDQCGVARVRFAAADGQFLVDPEAPYEFYMDTALVGSVQAQGRMRVDAVVTDLGGRTAAASVSYTHLGSGPPNPP